jgi:hypothetical protein
MRDVRIALRARGEKMENGAVMPDVDWSRLPLIGDIGFNPRDACRSRTQPHARASQRRGRHVQHRDAAQAPIEQLIDETGIPAPDIDDSGIRADVGVFQQS